MVQGISILVAILFFAQVLFYTSKNKLQDQQALIWLILSFSGLLLALFLPVMNNVAQFLEIEYMPSLIFVLAFLIILTMLVFQTTTITKQQIQIKQIAQQLSYATKHIDELRNEGKKEDNKNVS
ncbi:DUF2304 domain-containing protein [Planococcus sp. CP5-4]|uniref:DUF2304 domain-containing protein n=1 Tax=Planococcus TaxID=1372 RepID=UPI001B8CAC18|nr:MULTISPECIES: DUF2304 domain-containing protein [unclassified Planococcus (in: firmicutes)]MBU9673420.1 DUF2304 domain-containing protein [Planococcus sp. CP5-4_YE]MBV0908193.1 DUF2304 domain-containing protein [Planococcus sp. CP5-4_UN]MBW6062254.1 DUF2304 domain-containing protein [Planococcus sp. CP5-4]